MTVCATNCNTISLKAGRLAKMVLEEKFITPEGIEAGFFGHVRYTPEQIKRLQDNIPDQEDLEWCQKNQAMLLPGPPEAMSLIQLREFGRGLSVSRTAHSRRHFHSVCWYESGELFAEIQKIHSAFWLGISWAALKGSCSSNWKEQSDLVRKQGGIVPSAAEMSWALLACHRVNKEALMPRVWVRTSSVDSIGSRVYVGHHVEKRDGQNIYDAIEANTWRSASARSEEVGVAISKHFSAKKA